MNTSVRCLTGLTFLLLLAGTQSATAAEVTLRVMSFNLWHGGEAGGQPLTQSAEAIRGARADIVGIQEADGEERNNVREDNGPKIAELLGWSYLRLAGRRGILSRFPIRRLDGVTNGVMVTCGQVPLRFFNVHFPASPYQPYQLLNIPYGDAPFISTQQQAIDWATKSRGTELAAVLKELQKLVAQQVPLVLTGDFNEPSHLDWTERSRQAGLCPIAVAYPTTKRVAELGLLDTFRLIHPDEVRTPGFTWTPLTTRDDPADHHDRIDYVFAAGSGVTVVDSEIVGEQEQTADIVVQPWPSDHRAVVTTLRIAE